MQATLQKLLEYGQSWQENEKLLRTIEMAKTIRQNWREIVYCVVATGLGFGVGIMSAFYLWSSQYSA